MKEFFVTIIIFLLLEILNACVIFYVSTDWNDAQEIFITHPESYIQTCKEYTSIHPELTYEWNNFYKGSYALANCYYTNSTDIKSSVLLQNVIRDLKEQEIIKNDIELSKNKEKDSLSSSWTKESSDYKEYEEFLEFERSNE